jgi:thymidylate synthase ThyX
MEVELIYSTPDLHKLVESIARVCYQSYEKVSPTSHNMIKGIMGKGHLSVASSGNIVFQVGMFESRDELYEAIDSLLVFKQINNFIRWTTPQHVLARNGKMLISMNVLTLMDIEKGIRDFTCNSALLDYMLKEVAKVPCLQWFLDPTTEVPPSDSYYIGSPTLDTPVILSQDYTALKELGLTEYELDMHSTITVDLMTDRATGLQMWRHGDMTGGCELSQRYCDRSSALVRRMVDIDKYPSDLALYMEAEGLTVDEAKEHFDAVVQTIDNHYESTVSLYADLNDNLKELGVSGKRAKEIARSVLPNAMSTRIIQCRPLRQWKHFISLRDTVHAQSEIRQDTQALKQAFEVAGIEYA